LDGIELDTLVQLVFGQEVGRVFVLTSVWPKDVTVLFFLGVGNNNHTVTDLYKRSATVSYHSTEKSAGVVSQLLRRRFGLFAQAASDYP
jgi:hypothetical protein